MFLTALTSLATFWLNINILYDIDIVCDFLKLYRSKCVTICIFANQQVHANTNMLRCELHAKSTRIEMAAAVYCAVVNFDE